jgi:hypothetical protein
MKTSSIKQSLLLALVMLAGHTMAWSQCIVYNARLTGTSSGKITSSYIIKGYTIVGPSQKMKDGVTRYQYATFLLSSGTEPKYLTYDINSPVNGTPSSGGLLISLVKQGNTLKELVTSSDTFESDTVSGIATYSGLLYPFGQTYFAKTLSATYSGWAEESDENRHIGFSTSTANNPIKVYKYTASDSYTYNEYLTKRVGLTSFVMAVDQLKSELKRQGYAYRGSNPGMADPIANL